jgi:hypothetical protein
MNRLRILAAAIILALAALVGTAQPAAAGQNGTSVYNHGPVGIGIYVDWNGGYDYVLSPGWWSYPNAKGVYVGPGWCIHVWYQGRYAWSAGPGVHSFAWWYNDRTAVQPYRC